MKYGCCISLKNIENAKKFGYDFIELSGKEIMSINDAEWGKVKNSIAIPVIGFNSFCDGDLPLIGKDVNQDNIKAYIQKIIKRGIDLNIKSIGIGAPKARTIYDNFSYQEATDQMKWFLTEIANSAIEANIQILYESINHYNCNFCNDTQEAYHTVKELNLPNLHLVYDVYHAILNGEQLIYVENLFDEIKHVHLCSWNKENKNRFYLFEKDREYVKQSLLFLRTHGYDSTVSIEASDTDFLEVGFTSLKMLRELDVELI